MSSNVKLQRINSDILKILTVAIQQKMGEENFDGIIILRAETSADLSECKVFYSASGDKAQAQEALEKSSGFLRNEIAQSISMKHTPRLRFFLDRGAENASRVEELLAQINSEGKK